MDILNGHDTKVVDRINVILSKLDTYEVLEETLKWLDDQELTELSEHLEERFQLTPTLIHVCSSNGEIYCDNNGNVIKIVDAYEPQEGEEPNYILNIKQFNFTECRAYWNDNSMDCFDILDLGGVNKDGTTFAPDYQWRNDIANGVR